MCRVADPRSAAEGETRRDVPKFTHAVLLFGGRRSSARWRREMHVTPVLWVYNADCGAPGWRTHRTHRKTVREVESCVRLEAAREAEGTKPDRPRRPDGNGYLSASAGKGAAWGPRTHETPRTRRHSKGTYAERRTFEERSAVRRTRRQDQATPLATLRCFFFNLAKNRSSRSFSPRTLAEEPFGATTGKARRVIPARARTHGRVRVPPRRPRECRRCARGASKSAQLEDACRPAAWCAPRLPSSAGRVAGVARRVPIQSYVCSPLIGSVGKPTLHDRASDSRTFLGAARGARRRRAHRRFWQACALGRGRHSPGAEEQRHVEQRCAAFAVCRVRKSLCD